MLLNSLVLPNGIWQMQLFQINQSEDSSKITIMYDNPSGQLHQRSITWAFNYNRTYSKILYWVKQWISLVTEIWNIWNTYAICRNDDGCVHKSLKVYRYRLKSVSTISCAAMQLSMQIRSTKCCAFSGLMLKLTSIIAGPGITRQWIWLRLLKANIQQ